MTARRRVKATTDGGTSVRGWLLQIQENTALIETEQGAICEVGLDTVRFTTPGESMGGPSVVNNWGPSEVKRHE